MSKSIFTDKQDVLESYYEFYHYYDVVSPAAGLHQHSFYEIFLFLSDHVDYNIEGKIYHLHSGDILLTNSFDIHRPEISPDSPCERYVIRIRDSFFENTSFCGPDLKKCFTNAASKDYRLIRPSQTTLTHLKELCSKIDETQQDCSKGSHALTVSYLLQFLVYLSRCYEMPLTFLDDITENRTINQVITYINENITRSLSLDELSDRFLISKFYLCKQFKNYTGMSVYQYIMKKRLTVSLGMLRRGMPVTSACLECGFNDYSNYLKAFKREFGKNPKEFLKVTG